MTRAEVAGGVSFEKQTEDLGRGAAADPHAGTHRTASEETTSDLEEGDGSLGTESRH